MEQEVPSRSDLPLRSLEPHSNSEHSSDSDLLSQRECCSNDQILDPRGYETREFLSWILFSTLWYREIIILATHPRVAKSSSPHVRVLILEVTGSSGRSKRLENQQYSCVYPSTISTSCSAAPLPGATLRLLGNPPIPRNHHVPAMRVLLVDMVLFGQGFQQLGK